MRTFVKLAAPVMAVVMMVGGAAGCNSANSKLVGTWEGGASDIGASYVVVLQLNSDGSYTKELRTNIGAGGTHTVTWTADGMTVHLSGDGNWPAVSHDLSTFKKVS